MTETKETKETIDVLVDNKHIRSFDLERLTKHISIFDFYSLPVSEIPNTKHDFVFLSKDDSSTGATIYDKRDNHAYYSAVVKPYSGYNKIEYYNFAGDGLKSFNRDKKNWFDFQSELVELKEEEGTPGFKIPRFIKNLIPKGMKIQKWDYNALSSTKEKCYFVNYVSDQFIEFFEFDPEEYKKSNRDYYWTSQHHYKNVSQPKITHATYSIDKKSQSFNYTSIYINGKQVLEKEAFKIKAKYDIDKFRNIENRFGTRFKQKVYDKLSEAAIENFEAALKTNESKKLTYMLTERDVWDLTFGPLKQGIHYTSSDKQIEAFVNLVNSYYEILKEDKMASKEALTTTGPVTTLNDKQQNGDTETLQEKNKMAITAKDKVLQIAISDGQEVAKRVATKQISKLMQDTLVKALTQDLKGKKKSDTKTALEEFFASEKGMAVIQVFCGVGLPFVQKYIPEKYHSKLTMISDEMRIQGETTAALELIGAVEPMIKMAAGGIMDSLNQFSAAEEFVRIETSSVESVRTDNQKEAEIVELASAKERAKA